MNLDIAKVHLQTKFLGAFLVFVTVVSVFGGIDTASGLVESSDPNSSISAPQSDYLSFDGANDYLWAPDSMSLNQPSSFSLEAWFYFKVLPASRTFYTLISKGNNSETPGQNTNYILAFDNTLSGSGTALVFGFENSAGADTTLRYASAFNLNQWYHVTGVFDDQGDSMRLYLNDLQVAQLSTTQVPDHGVSQLRIADSQENSGYRRFINGYLDDVRIWSRALSLPEIIANENVELVGSEPGLAAYWKFNDQTGQLAQDMTAGNNTLTLGVSQTVDNADPTWATSIIDRTPPTVSITNPTSGMSLRGTVDVTAEASDDKGVAGVFFKVDGTALGQEDTAAPYTLSWNTISLVNGGHTLTAIARDTSGNQTTSVPVDVTIDNPVDSQGPTVSIVSPQNFDIVSGTVMIAASASDENGVSGVQFTMDGLNFSAEDTQAPYEIAWNTSNVVNGTHTIGAIARDTSGNVSSATPVSVTVKNIPATDCDLNTFSFGSFSDTYEGQEGGLDRVLDEMLAKDPNIRFITVNGDGTTLNRVGDHVISQLSDNLNCNATQFPYFPAVGNHNAENSLDLNQWADTWANNWTDMASSSRLASQMPGLANFKRGPTTVQTGSGPFNIPPGTIYAFDYGNAHFIFLNNYDEGLIGDSYGGIHDQNGSDVFDPSSSQLDWLQQDLEQNTKTSTYVFDHLAMSTPVYSLNNPPPGWSEHNSSFDTIEATKLFGDHNVTAVFHGHDHVMSRKLVNADHTAAYEKLYFDIVNDPNLPTGDASLWDQLQGPGRFWQVDTASLYNNRYTYAIVKITPTKATFETYYSPDGATARLYDTWSVPLGDAVGDKTAPAISVTSPSNDQVVGGVVQVSAQASDNFDLGGVQFYLDGTKFGGEDTQAPYSIVWDTTLFTDGFHTITAVARDVSGNRTTSLGVQASVLNSDNTPPVISGLNVSAITKTSAQINWQTDEPSTGQVEYGTSEFYGGTIYNSNLSLSHTFVLEGLTPDTTYHFRVSSADANGSKAIGQDQLFSTLPDSVQIPPKQIYLDFDGVDDNVYIPNSGNLAEGAALTVSAWVKPKTNGTAMTFVSRSRSGFLTWNFRRIASNNRLSFEVKNAGGATLAAQSDKAFGTDLGWHFITGVYDGSNVSIYVDGINVDTSPNKLTGSIYSSYNYPVCIGSLAYNATSCISGSSNASIDDVRIYDRALTPAEIGSSMNSELTGGEPGLVGYWKFDEGVGQTVHDSSSGARDGILGSGLSVEPKDPTWIVY